MALTSLTKDFVTRSGLSVEGTNLATTSTYTNGLNTGTFQSAGGASFAKNIIVGSTATFYGISYFNNQLVANNSATIATTLAVTGISTLAGVVVPTGSTLVASGGQAATGASNASGALQVTGGAGISGNLYVGGTAYLTGDLYVDGTQFVVNSQSLNAGEKALVLSTGSTSAIIATGAGVYIGASSSTAYTSFTYDGINSWVIPNGAATGGLKVQGLTSTYSTNTGALQVAGGLGIAGGVFVGGVITATNINAVLGTATNPAALYGGTQGSIVYQGGVGVTSFLAPATAGYVLQTNGVAQNPSWTALGAVTAGNATTASYLANGNVGQIPYQTGPGATAFSGGLTYGAANQTLTATNVTIPGVTNATSTNTGALQVAGGVGIGSDLYVGGNINVAGLVNFVGVGADKISSTTGTFVNVSITGTGVALTIPNGNASIGGLLTVTGQAAFNGGLTATNITATTLTVTGNETVGGSLVVTGNVTATIVTATTVTVTGNETVGGLLTVTGQAAFNGGLTATIVTATTLNVTGTSIFTGQAAFNGGATATNITATTLTVTGTSIFTGQSAFNGGATATNFTATTLTVTGNENISGSLVVTGNITATNITATSITVSNLTNNGNFNVSGSIVATGNITATIITATSIAVSGNETVGGSLVVTGNLQATIITATTLILTGNETEQGVLSITNVTGTTSTTTGALTVAGGVGINGGVFVGGTVTATNLIATNATIQNLTLGAPLSFVNITTTNIVVQGQATFLNVNITGTNVVSGVSTFSNTVNVTSSTNATNTTTGALQVIGGVGIGRDVQVGGAIFAGVNTSGTTATTVIALQSNAFQESSYISQVLGSGQSGIEQYLDAMSTSTYRSAEYTVQITDFPKIHIGKILLMHDGTSNIYLTEFAVVTNSGALGTFDAAFTGTNVVLKFTPNATPTAMTIKLRRTAITV